MSARRCILHVGPPKTGTTAIQRTLHRHRDALAAQGWAYPPIGIRFFAHHTLAEAAQDGRPEFAGMADTLGAIEQNIVLSSELLAKGSVEALRRLRAALRCDDIRVIFYVRSFVDVFASLWSETIKSGAVADFALYGAEAVAGRGPGMALRADIMLPRLAEAFGREAIALHLFAAAIDTHGDVATHFLDRVLGVTGIPTIADQANAALPPLLAEVLRQVNRRAPAIPRDARFAAARALAAQIGPRADAYLREITLSADRPIFRQAERQLATQWRDRFIDPPPAGDALFAARSRTVKLIDPALWLDHPDLAAALKAIA